MLSVSASVMASSPALLMRLVASAYTVAEKAGTIVRKVLQSGELGIVEKVRHVEKLSTRILIHKHFMISPHLRNPKPLTSIKT